MRKNHSRSRNPKTGTGKERKYSFGVYIWARMGPLNELGLRSKASSGNAYWIKICFSELKIVDLSSSSVTVQSH